MLAWHQYMQSVIAIALGIFLLLRLRLAARAAYRKDFVPALETTLTVSDSGVESRSAKGDSHLDWSAFVRYSETKRLLLLYIQSRFFLIIPKRAFSGEDWDILRGVLGRKVGRTSGTGNLSYQGVAFGLVLIVAFILVLLALHRTKAI
jgi:hypothetical protein